MTLGPHRRTLLALAAALTLALPALAAPASSAQHATGLADDMSLGSPTAKVTVVEYASASCPHCARFNNDVLPAFKKKYVDTGRVRYVFREFLTEPVQVAAAGFLLARCAGKARYFQVLDEFFHGQAHAYETGDIKTLILSAGGKAGLDEKKIQACLSDKTSADALNERVQRYASEDKVEFTPTFTVNGQKLPPLDHEVTLQDLDDAIQPVLNPARPGKGAKAGKS